MTRTKSDSIRAMGLKRLINTNYGHFKSKFGMPPYDKLVKLFRAGEGDTAIAREFSDENRELKYQSVRNWRAWYLTEQEHPHD